MDLDRNVPMQRRARLSWQPMAHQSECIPTIPLTRRLEACLLSLLGPNTGIWVCMGGLRGGLALGLGEKLQ